MDDIGVGIGGQGLGGMIGIGGWAGRGVGEQNADKRDRWRRVMRNSSAEGMSSSKVNEESSLQARISVDCCWETVVSSSSSSEGKKSDDGWFLRVLGGDSDCKGSHQLELFKKEMVAVCESTTLVGKLDLLLCLVLGKGQAQPLRFKVQGTRRVYTL